MHYADAKPIPIGIYIGRFIRLVLSLVNPITTPQRLGKVAVKFVSRSQDWGNTLLPHWETLRRQVNNMRSDPLARWSSLDYRLGYIKPRSITRVISVMLSPFLFLQ